MATPWAGIYLALYIGVFSTVVIWIFNRLTANYNTIEKVELTDTTQTIRTFWLRDMWQMFQEKNKFLDDPFWTSIPYAESRLTHEVSDAGYNQTSDYIKTKRTVFQIMSEQPSSRYYRIRWRDGYEIPRNV